jgi:apolipoprotein N-acyltransferase
MRSRSAGPWLLVIASGVLQIIVFPSPSLYFLCWIALVPLLLAILWRRESLGKSFLLAYASGIIWYVGSCYWVYHVMNSYGGLSPVVAFGVLILFCLYLGLYHGLFGILVALVARSAKIGPTRALLFAPFIWVAVELARARITGFPWDLLGYTQIDNIPLTRIATVTGVYGVSWVVALVNCVFVLTLFRFRQQGPRLLLVSLAAAVALQSGTLVKPEALPADRAAVLLQENLPVDFNEWTAEYYDRTIASLVQLSSSQLTDPQVRGESPAVVIWPESPAPFYSVDPKFLHWMTALAADSRAYLIVGSLGVNPAKETQQHAQIFNSAVLVSPDGGITARYDKIHLVPFGEYVPFKSFLVFAEKLTKEVSDFSRGSLRTVFTLGEHKAGAFICYESIFPDEVRQFARNGAELFVNISNDGWFGKSGASGQHLNMARMRAIENERWLLRSTNTGITGSIDPLGRLVARAPRNVRTALQVQFAFTNVTTFYTRFGDWFALGCAIISLIALIVAGRRSWSQRECA